MRRKVCILVGSGLLAVLAVGFLATQERAAGQPKTVADEQDPKSKPEKDAHAADRAAIRKTMQTFTEAFQKGDAAAAGGVAGAGSVADIAVIALAGSRVRRARLPPPRERRLRAPRSSLPAVDPA